MSGGTWLVTGGTGAFGQAFTRYLLDHEEPASVRILARREGPLAEMRATFNDGRLRFMMGDVASRDRMRLACEGVDYVAHAAAAKRIEMCEENPWECVESNVNGTHSVAQACIAAGVKKACFISSDKSCLPETLYGASKQLAERLWNRSNAYAGGRTVLASVRYGNVAGSTGSVIPLWQQQARTGTIGITDSRMTRFFLGMGQAINLVMTALRDMQGGEIFLAKIKSASIPALARVIAPDATVITTGLRGSEKLHETMVSPDEVRRTFDCGSHYVIAPEGVTWKPFPIVPNGVPVASNFTYSSNTAEQLSVSEIQAMLSSVAPAAS